MKHLPTIALLMFALSGCALATDPTSQSSEAIGAAGDTGAAGAPNEPAPCATQAQQDLFLAFYKAEHNEIGQVGEWVTGTDCSVIQIAP